LKKRIVAIRDRKKRLNGAVLGWRGTARFLRELRNDLDAHTRETTRRMGLPQEESGSDVF